MKRSGLRHGVRLQFSNGRLEAHTYPFVSDVPDDGVIVKNHHTLVGTHVETTPLRHLTQIFAIPDRPGYTTLSTIEEAGCRCTQFDLGSWLVLPARYETFSAVPSLTAAVLARPSSDTDDPIHALFVPLVSYALILSDRIGDAQPDDCVLFFGFGIVGAILSQLLRSRYNMTVIVVRTDDDDLPVDIICECGADEVFSELTRIPGRCLRTLTKVVILRDSERVRQELEAFALDAEQQLRPTSWNMLHQTRVMAEMYDRSMRMLRDRSVDVNMLVADHIHPEAGEQAFLLSSHTYLGKMLIYDW